MKEFVVPSAEVVHFGQRDVIATSTTCICVDCKDPCPEGSDNCQCVELPEFTNQNP